MAEYKKNHLALSSGKQIKLFGTCIGIGRTLELAEGYAPNIFASAQSSSAASKDPDVLNPLGLTAEEFQEIADYHIRLWLDFKDAIRKVGVGGKLFIKG